MTKTVLITGSSSGIGHAAAMLFAQQGWNVIATMRNPEREQQLTHFDNVRVTRLDVQYRSSIQSAIRAGIARFGRIDALINNAGYGQYGLFEAISRDKVQQQFDVNVFGVMDVTRAVLPELRKNKGGMIINISSGAGIFTLPLISLYCASKFALEGFSEALAFELASQNIVVKIVQPHGGVTDTRFSERQVEHTAVDAALTDYAAFVEKTDATFAGMTAERTIPAEAVAQVIYEAATDGTDRLRYLVGADVRGFIKARQELADQEYVEYMRDYFRNH